VTRDGCARSRPSASANERIERARRGLVDGPPVALDAFDVDEVVEAWRRGRAQDGASR
jgi:hypothetical protein